jgi:hypothetical protein
MLKLTINSCTYRYGLETVKTKYGLLKCDILLITFQYLRRAYDNPVEITEHFS